MTRGVTLQVQHPGRDPFVHLAALFSPRPGAAAGEPWHRWGAGGYGYGWS